MQYLCESVKKMAPPVANMNFLFFLHIESSHVIGYFKSATTMIPSKSRPKTKFSKMEFMHELHTSELYSVIYFEHSEVEI